MDSSPWIKWWHFQIHSAIFKVRGGEEFPLRGCGWGRHAAPWMPSAWNFQIRLTLWYNLCRWTQFDLLWTLRRTRPTIRYLRHLMPLLHQVIEKVKKIQFQINFHSRAAIYILTSWDASQKRSHDKLTRHFLDVVQLLFPFTVGDEDNRLPQLDPTLSA